MATTTKATLEPNGFLHPVASTDPDYPDMTVTSTLEVIQWKLSSRGVMCAESQTVLGFIDDGTWIMVQLCHMNNGWLAPSLQVTIRFFNMAHGLEYNNSTTFDEKALILIDQNTSCKVSKCVTLTRLQDNAGYELIVDTVEMESKRPERQIFCQLQLLATEKDRSVVHVKNGRTDFDTQFPSKEYIIHRFVPRLTMQGSLRLGVSGEYKTITGDAMFLYAYQHCKIYAVAKKWHTLNFQDRETNSAITFIQFETPQASFGGAVVSQAIFVHQ